MSDTRNFFDDKSTTDERVTECKNTMDQESISRYSRQLIMPEIGVQGQQALLRSSALVIGAGGLGCPVIQYLTAAGLGRIGIVDYDEVELSNLHRQILHTEAKVKSGTHKATSAADAATALNSKIKIDQHHLQLDRDNVLEIVQRYDVVIDATDNVPSRYLISDACVLLNKPLISGSALRWEGQLTIYHYKAPDEENYGPCYRCLYPNPPAPETVTNCSDGGVLGVVPGIIGCLQALEAVKIMIGVSPSYHKKLLVFDGLVGMFRSIKIRGFQESCVVCGKNPTISKDSLPDYEKFCGMAAADKCITIKLLPADQRISPVEYKTKFIDSQMPHILLDVRQHVELDICALPNTTNGNDSQKAVKILSQYITFELPVSICDMIGGLMAWGGTVDKAFPYY
ncbi:unnamed protein product [Clavelina lepadiformis]|uniref:Adenylyltransferase and sulfurtransferase MOCS3 homolog n=1 Tax=Clavelina lepadiformis TaxID=159417 RepID=A0ABP0G214_CLALP